MATELWHVGIVHQPVEALCVPGALAAAKITWLPKPKSFRFIADPFGIWQGDLLTIFVEALDYRTKRGEIHYYQYDKAWNLRGKGIALQTPHHLSYPSIIRDGDAIYMLPEANKSGKLTLYRAVRFPDQWEPVADLLDLPAVDASVIQFENRWWMFYTLPGANSRALRELHVAYADNLLGPWKQHNANPVRNALDSARPGGTPFMQGNAICLPVQDGTTGYGTALNLLRIYGLTPDTFEATVTLRLSPEGLCPDYVDGLHTLAAAGDVTLIDVKQICHSPMRRLINIQRKIRRLFR